MGYWCAIPRKSNSRDESRIRHTNSSDDRRKIIIIIIIIINRTTGGGIL
jgi:hypothetical protein